MDAEFFDSVIKVDDGYSDTDDEIEEKENKKPCIVKSIKAKKEQFNKIDDFMNQFKEELIGKKEFTKLWKALIDKVNSLGPPIYTEAEWKSKWTQHKYNVKRKWLSKPLVQSAQDQRQAVHTMGDIFDVGSSSQGAQFSVKDQPPLVHAVGDIFDQSSTIQGAGRYLNQDQPQLVQTIALGETVTNSDILERLHQIIEKQDAALEKMDKTNSLLEKIARRA